MNTELILLIVWVGGVLSVLFAFIWIARKLPKGHGGGNGGHGSDAFSDEFRQKLQERGIARFERTVDQNAAFLQQDIRKMSDDITDYIKEQATNILKEEFGDQKQAVIAAQQHMAESFAKVDRAVQEYQHALADQLKKEVKTEKQKLLDRFQENMADVVTHHVQQTLGTHMQIDEQVEFILKNLEENKTAIVEDIKREL